jgi:hypothetical protein
VTLASLLFLLAGTARADINVSATINNVSPTRDDQIVLAVTVSGPHASLPDPVMPPLDNFTVYSSGRSQNISFINGSMTSSIVHTFVLVPHFVGKGTIGPIKVSFQGKTVQTEPIEIQVRPPSAAGSGPPPGAHKTTSSQARPGGSAQGPDVFIEAQLDKKSAFVNEQVTLSVKFYTAVNLLGNPQYNSPKVSGFISEDLPPERHGETVIRGRRYYYSEIKSALFPAQAGKLTIGPASVRCQVQEDLAVDPFAPEFFQRFFSQGVSAQNRDLRSEPLLLSAEPLPEAGKPASFSGAVGRYSVSASIDRPKVKVGEAVNLSVTVTGAGNLKAIGEPKLPALPDFRAYDTVTALNVEHKDDLVRGSKSFKTVLVPRVSGTLTIPPVSFSYFDPSKKAYMQASSLPLSVSVDPGDPGQAPVGADYASREQTARSVTAVNEDIRYLKTRDALPLATRALGGFASLGLFHAAPFLLFALSLGAAQYREMQDSDKQGTRFRGAARTASAKIKEAKKAADGRAAAEILSTALARYLGDKLGESPSGLTWKRLQELLGSRVPEPTMRELKDVWDELDLLRFAPQSDFHADRLPDRLLELLKTLEKEIKR